VNAKSLADERTVKLPNGLPLSGQLQFQLVKDNGLYGFNSGLNAGSFLTPADVAARLVQAGRDDLGTPTQYALYKPAARSRVMMKFMLAEGAILTRTLEDTILDPHAQAVAYQDLPDNLRKEIQALEAQITQYFSRIHISTGSRPASNRPPPP